MKTFNLLFNLKLLIVTSVGVQAQSPQSLKLVLVNLGPLSCYDWSSPEQQLFTDVFSTNPALLLGCNPGLSLNYTFIAYNPKDRKVYYLDSHIADSTTVYMLDYNFSGVMSCPASMSPLFTLKSNVYYFCFDEDGNNHSLSNYNGAAAQGTVKRIDFLTGADIAGTQKLIERQKAQIRITIYDGSGRALKKQRNDLHPGENHVIISELQSLSKGTYILKTEDGTQTLQFKLVK